VVEENKEAEEEMEEISLRSPWDLMKEAHCIAVAS
jgi:hypothetical protein